MGAVAAGPQVVDDAVVELEEGQVELGQDGVLVVAGVADQGPAVGVAGQVLGGQPRAELGPAVAEQQQLPAGAAVLGVEIGHVQGAAAVQHVEVEPGGAEVLDLGRVVAELEAGHRVEGEVVVDQLAEVGVAGRQVGVVEVAALLAHAAGQLVDQPPGGLVGGQAGEHPAEPRPRAGRAGPGTGPGDAVSLRRPAGPAAQPAVRAFG